MGKSKEKTKKLPPKTDVETTVFIKKKGTRKRVGTIKIGKSKESTDTYYQQHGIVPHEKDKSIFDVIIDGLEGLPDRAKRMHGILNYKEKDAKGKELEYKNDIYTQTFASSDEEEFNIVFGKFREFLNANKLEIVDQMITNGTIDADYMKEDMTDPSIAAKHEYIIDETHTDADEDLIQLLNDNFKFIVEIITDPTILILPGLTYNIKDLNVSDDKDSWTEGDMRILQNPDNRENAYYVIGQVFNIIDPTFNDNFVTDDFNEKLDVEKGFVDMITKDIPKFFGFIDSAVPPPAVDTSSPIGAISSKSAFGFL